MRLRCTSPIPPASSEYIYIYVYVKQQYLLTAIELPHGGSGYFTCIQNMKLVINKFMPGGLHEKHVVATRNLGKPSQQLLIDTGKLRKTCVEVAGRRTFRIYIYIYIYI